MHQASSNSRSAEVRLGRRAGLKGVRANCHAAIFHNGEAFAESTGELQFTEYGISGPVIFEISRDVCQGAGQWLCRLDFLPGISRDKLQAALGQDFLPETVVTGWDSALWPCVATVNNGDGSYTYEFRYAQTVETMDGKDLELKPLFTSFTVPGKLTGAQMQTLKDVKIVVEGHAIQANPFTTADEAWAAFAEQYNTQQGNG